MASGFNFSFGSSATPGSSTQAQTKPVGLALPSTATPSTSGFQLGSSAAATTSGTLGSLFTSTPATGLNQAKTTPFGFGTAPTASTAGTGFSLGGAPSTALSSTGFNLGGITSSTSGTSGFNLGGTTSTTGGSTGFNLGGTTATPSTGLGGFGAKLGTTTSSGLTLGGGLGGFGATSTKPGLTLGATPASTGFSLGGGLGTTSSAATGIFASTSTAATSAETSHGLGGIDLKSSMAGGAGAADKTSDSKVVKESQVPPEICATVDEAEKFVKAQKEIREKSARKSSKPLYRVQENISSLKHMLYLVSNDLQRNAVAIEKLKHKSAQELKHVEIAQRTKETPPGLQYENTAPMGYFIQLVEEFETNMIQYRQQIEEMEHHLTSLGQTTSFTPQELTILLRKLYESFMALAAHLQVIHDSVKTQKEHFLNYRQVFHGDRMDIFEQRRKTRAATVKGGLAAASGPTPFSGVTNQVASAMATALNRPQQPAAAAAGFGVNPGSFGIGGVQPSLGGGGTSLFGTGGTGFSSVFKPAATQSGAFGSTSFGGFGSASTSVTKPDLSFGGAKTGGLFGSSASAGTSGFNLTGSTQPASAGFGTSSFATPGFGQPNQGFQLGKPPAGNKRGKKA